MEIIAYILLVILGIFAIYIISHNIAHNRELIQSVTSFDRGTWSERNLVLKLLKHDFPSGAIFHDLYLTQPNGHTCQIDAVLATPVGLIVFEVKDYSGWLFGRGDQRNWTQVLAYGREKHQFYNPVIQNHNHIAELRKQSSQFRKMPIYSVIVFYGNCQFRNISNIPSDTIITTPWNVINAAKSIVESGIPAQYTDKHEIVRILKQAVSNGENPYVREQHANRVREIKYNQYMRRYTNRY